jgi:hypothetical protein
MKKQIILTIFALILLTSFVSGELEFWEQKSNMGNGTIQNHLTLFYSKSGLGIGDDYVSGNNPFEVYLLYNIYPQSWNSYNPNFKVTKCEFIIRFLGHLQNNITTILNETYTPLDNDIMKAKYFIKLNDGDSFIADEICYFENKNFTELLMPSEMQLVTPSWECKSCQYYEWSLQERDILKAKAIGDNVVTISGYIKKLFLLNFEIWLALFWFFLILMIFTAVGLIFIGVYWLFLYMKKLTK